MVEKVEEKDLGTTFVETLGKSELAQVVPDYLEIGLDSQLVEGVFRELPIIRSSLAFYKTTLGVRDFLLLKKILLFLKESGKIDDSERKEFVSLLSQDKKYQRRVGEQLLLYIDRLDDIDKSAMLGKLFNGYIKKEIDYDTFQRLANAVDRTFIGDLKKIRQYYATSTNNFRGVEKDILHHLSQSGLVSMKSYMIADADGIIFDPSILGEIFIRLVLS